MGSEYKKYEILAENDKEKIFEVFSTTKSYEDRKNEILSWIEKLSKSVGVTDYRVDVTDAYWSEATILKDKLFETHYPA